MKSFLSIVVFVLALIFSRVCNANNQATQSTNCQVLAETYFVKPLKQTITDFVSYDLDTQYAIYICGNQFMHPPALHLAAPFASEGERAASFLSKKLAQCADDATVRDILRVLAEMQRQHTYDVASDKPLMEIIEGKVLAIGDSDWREFATTLLTQIKGAR